MAYLDIKAAYDTVDRSVLWDILAKKRLPREEWLLMLKDMFDRTAPKSRSEGTKAAGSRMWRG